MKNLFVSYEIAKKLKEKGFNEECLKYYEYDGGLESPNGVTIGICKNEMFLDLCSAPLYQQVLDWFREKHNLVIYSRKHKSYKVFISFINEDEVIESDGYYFTLHKAIEEALKLI